MKRFLPAFALAVLLPLAALAGNGSVPTGSHNGNFLTRHGTTYSPPQSTAGKTMTWRAGGHGAQYGWFGLFGVFGLVGLWRSYRPVRRS